MTETALRRGAEWFTEEPGPVLVLFMFELKKNIAAAKPGKK